VKAFKLVFAVIFLMSFLFVLPAYGDDLFNVGTVIDFSTNDEDIDDYDNVMGYYETATTITYIYKATWVDSSDHLHSKPFLIAGCNDNDAYLRAIVSAASDVNPIFHYSYDNRNTWVSETPADLDALSSTAVGDTLGCVETADTPATFHSGIWMVIELSDGSTALEDDEYCTVVISLRKDVPPENEASWPRQARVARGSNTNP